MAIPSNTQMVRRRPLVASWPILVIALVSLVVGSCARGDTRSDCATDDGAAAGNLTTVAPADARDLTVAEVFRRDERFTLFRKLGEETPTSITDSHMEVWDMEQRADGSKIAITLFAPTDTAFAALDPQVRTAWEEGRLDQYDRYAWIGHHQVDSAYPSAAFVEGLQDNQRSQNAELTLDPLTYAGCPVLQTDLEVSNGYIHVIAGVGVPDDIEAASTQPQP
jgi:Fasciclin domain